MFREHICLHQGGHGHEHEHEELTGAQSLALLSYMLDHNRSHADELHELAHNLDAQGKTDAALALHEALMLARASNEKLAEALKLASV